MSPIPGAVVPGPGEGPLVGGHRVTCGPRYLAGLSTNYASNGAVGQDDRDGEGERGTKISGTGDH